MCFFTFILLSLSTLGQKVGDNIDFVSPPQVDSVLCTLLDYVHNKGSIDRIIILWRECPGASVLTSYLFCEIPVDSEYDSMGNIENRLLWYKRRTNRVLNINSTYYIPIIYPLDLYTASGNKYPTPVVYLNGNEYLPLVEFNSIGKGYLYRNWKIEEDSLGQQKLRVSISVMDSVFLGW